MSVATIKKRIKIVKDLMEEVKKIKGNYQESLDNHAVVQQAQAEEEKLKIKISEFREKILAIKEEPALKAMEDQMKELKEEIKENKEVLSQELVDYYAETGTLEFTDDGGTVYIISFAAKLKSN